MFPVADMGLKLSFDLAPSTPVHQRNEQQCFPFFPNTLFQGQYSFILHVWHDVALSIPLL